MGVLLDGLAQETGVRRVGTDATLLLVSNAHHDVVRFKLPEAVRGSQWVSLIDTNNNQVGFEGVRLRARIRGDRLMFATLNRVPRALVGRVRSLLRLIDLTG